MSVDYALQMGIGWKLNKDETKAFFEKFEQENVPEKSHMEDRFNPKTGAKLNPKLIIDQRAEVSYFLDGVDVGVEENDLLDTLNTMVKGFYFDRVYSYDYSDNQLVIFLNLKPVEDGKTQIDCNVETFLEFYIPSDLFDRTTDVVKQLKALLPKHDWDLPTFIGTISIT